MGVWTIARTQSITPRWARELPRKYKNIKNPVFKKPGRKPKEITEDERRLVIETYEDYLVCATMLEKILDEKGIHINHNGIHRILLEAGLAKKKERKQKTRKYKCYEIYYNFIRKHQGINCHPYELAIPELELGKKFLVIGNTFPLFFYCLCFFIQRMF